MAWHNHTQAAFRNQVINSSQEIAICLLAIFFSLGLFLSGALADSNSATVADNQSAFVVLDGRELFSINQSNSLTATQRAEKINSLLKTKLKQYANSEQTPDVTVEKQANWTVVRVDRRHLVTVTKNDLIPGMMAQEQAQIWQEKIETALQQGIRERSPAYLTRASIKVAIALGCGSIAQFGLFKLNRYCRRKQLELSNKLSSSWAILGIFLLQAGIWLTLINYAANLFPLTRNWQYQILALLDNTFNAPTINLGGNTNISLRHILISILLSIGLWFLVRWVSLLLKSQILPLTGLEDTLQSSIAFLTRYGLLFLGLLLILNSSGIDFRSLTIIISALGVGIGFGLQTIAKDFISGIILSLTRPIKIGELVEVGEHKGLVLRIGARTTEISHVDRYIMTVPNSRFIEETIKNWHRSGYTRVKVYIDVAYDSDRDLVYKALLAAAQVHHPDILKHPPPKAQFRSFGDRSLLFRVVVFVKNPLKEPKVRNHLQKLIDINLRKYGIKIPFPQRDLNIKIPQIDDLVANLARMHAPNESQLYYPPNTSIKNNQVLESVSEEINIQAEYNWQALVAAMRGENGVEIKDRRYGLRVHAKTFIGSEAVDWLIEHEKATRAEAIAIGQLMIEQRLIHHVLDEHDFKDESLFYRFYLDEENGDYAAAYSSDRDWEASDMSDV